MSAATVARLARAALVAASLAVALLACSSADDAACLDGQCPGENAAGTSEEGAAAAAAPLCADMGKERIGLGGAPLTAGRIQAVAGADRGRMKPYTALVTEYARVLGEANRPVVITQVADAFAKAGQRTEMEPEANAVSLYTAYRAAFEGCLQLTGAIENAVKTPADPKFAVAPTAATAGAECAAWARRFWARTATPDEVRGCVEVAMTDSLKEDQTNGSAPVVTTPARRWAYACASVLTSTGFLTY